MRRRSSTAKQFCLLSPEDMDLLRWVAWGDNQGHIGIQWPGSIKSIPVANIIVERMGLEIPLDHVVDHRNRIPFDNQRENLRVVTRSQNNANNDALGVHYQKKGKLWIARVGRDHKRIYLGSFSTKEEALIARKAFLDKEGLVN